MPQGAKQGQGQRKPQGQTQGRPYLADGIFTPAMIGEMTKLDQKLLDNGIHPSALSFMYYTSLPKGHPDHLNQSEAARQFYPNVTIQTAKFRALNAFTQAWRLLLFGRKIEEFQKAWDTRNRKPVTERKNRRIPVEEKAEKKAKLDLRKAFRSQEGLGDRGKMTDEIQEKCDRYIEKHYDTAFKKTLSDLKEVAANRVREQLASV